MTQSNPTISKNCDCSDVCSLPSDALQARISMIRSDYLPQVRRTEELPDGLAWEFDAAMRAKVDALVALERECCSALDWRVVEASGGEGLKLEVHGIDPRSVRRLLGLGGGSSPGKKENVAGGFELGRLAKASGAGLAGSFFVCCVLPGIVFAVFGGTALAVTLTSLDRPIPFALVSVVMAVAAWRFLRRREGLSRASQGGRVE